MNSPVQGLAPPPLLYLDTMNVLANSNQVFDFIFLINLFIYFWLHWVFIAVRRLSLVARKRELLFVAVRGLLIVVASLVAEHGL